MNRHFHLGVPAALALLAAVGCDSTQVASTNADRVLPTVTIALQGLVSTPTSNGSVNVRSPLSVRVTATDNTALAAIVTRVEVDGVLLQTDDAVFPAAELLSKAQELAQNIAAKPPLAIAAARRCLLRARSTDPTTATDFESGEFGNLFASADGQEGMRAFVEKRAAVFRGQ